MLIADVPAAVSDAPLVHAVLSYSFISLSYLLQMVGHGYTGNLDWNSGKFADGGAWICLHTY